MAGDGPDVLSPAHRCAASANGIHAAIAPRAGGSLCAVAIARQRFDGTCAGDSLHGFHRRRPAPPSCLASRNAWRYVRRVRAYLSDHPGEAPGLEALCRITGVRARTLETSFREVTGLSPMKFLRVRRLNAGRHTLATGDPDEISVKSVAMSQGFWHLGRFARDYKLLFGENPSATLTHR